MSKGNQLLNGNIFEAMRMVLPEHRELMGRSEGMAATKTEPMEKFDEYRYVEIMEVLQEALENDLEINVMLKAGKLQPPQVMSGRPFVNGDKLFINRQRVPLENIIAVTRS